jgi:hypothetical protein
VHVALEDEGEKSGEEGDDQMARREWGRTCRNKQVSLCAKMRIFVHK